MKNLVAKIKKLFGFEGLTFKESMIVIYFTLSLCSMCVTDDSQLWCIALLVINFCISAVLASKIHFENDKEEGEE